MKIAIASDHAGFAYKERIKELLHSLGHEVRDFGPDSDSPVDYPAFIRPAAESVARAECERGFVLGGSGNGEAIVANKVRGVRCALCWSLETARWSREHNDANMAAIGQRTIPVELRVGNTDSSSETVIRHCLSWRFIARTIIFRRLLEILSV